MGGGKCYGVSIGGTTGGRLRYATAVHSPEVKQDETLQGGTALVPQLLQPYDSPG